MPLRHLIAHNRTWATQMQAKRPGFFMRLSEQQTPRCMWIGCSDSRVPANQITGLEPGEVSVHRNIANLAAPGDLNCLSTIQFAVDQLHAEHLKVVGRFGCGGVKAALHNTRVGLADNWLRHVKDVRDRQAGLLAALNERHRLDALCEPNVIEQVMNVAHTTAVQDAWAPDQALTLHGRVYGLSDGLLQDLHRMIRGEDVLAQTHARAVAEVAQRERR